MARQIQSEACRLKRLNIVDLKSSLAPKLTRDLNRLTVLTVDNNIIYHRVEEYFVEDCLELTEQTEIVS